MKSTFYTVFTVVAACLATISKAQWDTPEAISGWLNSSFLESNGITTTEAALASAGYQLATIGGVFGKWLLLSDIAEPGLVKPLNFAYPTSQAQYFASFFTTIQQPTFQGSFFPNCSYAALTAYNLQGLPISGPSSSLDTNALGQDKYDFSWTPDLGGYKGGFIIIMRAYRTYDDPDQEPFVEVDDLPAIVLNDKVISQPTQAFIESVSKALTTVIGPLMTRIVPTWNLDVSPYFFNPCFRPAQNKLAGVFPNANAAYLVCQINPSLGDDWVFKLEGEVPMIAFNKSTTPNQDSDPPSYIAVHSIMAVDGNTTETCDDITAGDLGSGQSYVLFVAKSARTAKTAGYDSSNSTHHFITWSCANTLIGTGNKAPMVVLRQVIGAVDVKQGLLATNDYAAQHPDERVPESMIIESMGATFPNQAMYVGGSSQPSQIYVRG